MSPQKYVIKSELCKDIVFHEHKFMTWEADALY